MKSEHLEIIAETILFSGLNEKELERVGKVALEKDFAKGQSVFLEGEEGAGFYIVSRGLVKIYKISMDGKEQILHIMGPGDPFGEVPVFSGQRFPANAETLTESDLLFFPRHDFVDLIAHYPSLAMNMLSVLSARLRQFTIQIENLTLREVPARLAAYLIYVADRDKQAKAVTLDISKGQLASLLGTVPETLSRALTNMKNNELIQTHGNTIVLLKRNELEELADRGR
jgi:CRP/FNR family transcriptional regulator